MPDTIPPPVGDASSPEVEVEFERWAQASARLLRRSVVERAEVLRESGLASQWMDVDEYWYEALIQDIDSGQLERLDRYMEICTAEMDRRMREESEVKSPLDAIGGPLDSATQVGDDGETDEAIDSATPAAGGKPLASVTPPLGSSSHESIEVDLTEIDMNDPDAEMSPDDTRVSAAIPELTSSD